VAKLYPGWVRRYAVGEEEKFGTAVNTDFGLPLTNNPDFDPGQNIVDTRQARGISYRYSGEFNQGTRSPAVTLEFQGHAENLALLLYTLFQHVDSEGASSPYAKTYTPYTSVLSFSGKVIDHSGTDGVCGDGTSTFTSDSADFLADGNTVAAGDRLEILSGANAGNWYISSVDSATQLTVDGTFVSQSSVNYKVYRQTPATVTLVRDTGASGKAQRITSAICRSMTLSCDEGGALMVSAEMIGKSIELDHTVTSDTFTISTDAPLLFQNLTYKLGGTSGVISSFSITLSNNAVQRWFDSQTPYEYILGDFTVEGRITIPWQGSNTEINNFISGTDKRIELYWGSDAGASDGDFYIAVNARYTGAPISGDEEIQLELPFVGVNDGTYDAVKVILADNVDWAWATAS